MVLSPSSMAWSLATIVPTSRSAQAAVFRPTLDLLGVPTRFLVDQIRSIDTQYVHGEPVAYLERDEMAEIEHAISRYLGLGLKQAASSAHGALGLSIRALNPC